MKDWADYQDIWGLVQQKGGDQGDTLNRTCAREVLKMLRYPDITPLGTIYWKLGRVDGKFRRSDDTSKWYGAWDRTSRDQLTPLVIMCGLSHSPTDRMYLKDIFLDHLRRALLFTYNTRRNFVYPTLEEHLQKSTPDVPWNYSWKVPDLTGPEFWNLYIRGFRAWFLYPLLMLGDIQTLLGSLTIRYSNRDDVINHALMLEYSKVRMPTLFSWLARIVTPRAFLQKRLDSFFGKEQEPPINELYKELK